jgi:anaphase-promoting complex subunit 13
MDSVYIRDGILIDIVDKDWMLDKIPFADIGVPLEELPDSEFNDLNGHSTQTLKEIEMKWTETGLHRLLDQISGNTSK